MLSAGQSADVVRFSSYEVHLRAGELYRAGRKIRLQVQPFHVLAMLLEHPGEVVAREDLQKKLWPADTFVDFDHSLNTAIKKLRQALGDDTRNPRFIETLPKRGYRFIGIVEPPTGPATSAAPPAKVAAASSLVGRVAKLLADSNPDFALVAVDESSAAEREKLEAANDDVGLSLLIAAQRVYLVARGTPVRILEVQEKLSRCQVRILDGEHYGKTALVPLKWLAVQA
jgi:DNA-binding winged helix-turn-helix (wHTH) protein